MSRPGDRLRAMAARVFDSGTMERLIDPVIADLQAEYGHATRRGLVWKRRWMLVVGYAACLKVVTLCGWRQLLAAPAGSHADRRRALGPMIGFSIAAAALATLTFVALPVVNLPASMHASWKSVLYLIPQALSLAVPVWLALGIPLGFRARARARRFTGAVVALGIVCAVASFGNVAWITPASNQAFRVSVSGRPDLPPGALS